MLHQRAEKKVKVLTFKCRTILMMKISIPHWHANIFTGTFNAIVYTHAVRCFFTVNIGDSCHAYSKVALISSNPLSSFRTENPPPNTDQYNASDITQQRPFL